MANVLNTDLAEQVRVATGAVGFETSVCIPIDGGFSAYSGV